MFRTNKIQTDEIDSSTTSKYINLRTNLQLDAETFEESTSIVTLTFGSSQNVTVGDAVLQATSGAAGFVAETSNATTVKVWVTYREGTFLLGI